MIKSFKVEIKTTNKFIDLFDKTRGVCRFVYNMYLSKNKELYDEFLNSFNEHLKNKQLNIETISKEDKIKLRKQFKKEYDKPTYISAFSFSKWLNNDFIPNNIEYKWIKDVPSKAVKQSIINAERSFKKFFNTQSNFPKYKKKNKNDCSVYLIQSIKVERHRIQIPCFKWVKLKEYGYIPTNKPIKSVTISKHSNKYFISALIDMDKVDVNFKNDGIGIDMGIKNIMHCSNKEHFKNINKSARMKKLQRKMHRLQRQVSRKYIMNKKGGCYKRTNNILKFENKITKLYFRMFNIRNDYYNKIVNKIINQEPKFIVLEDLKIKNLMKNKHLSKAIAEASWHSLRIKIESKCRLYNIELRICDTHYASSKLCSKCGYKKNDLKLKDRIYKCSQCHLEIDRDLNASINLKNVKKYKVA